MTVYRRNPLLMTVMGANPGPRTRKGAERALDAEISSAWHHLMSGVQVSVMDIPRIFRDIKLEIAGGMPLQDAVLKVGSRYRVNRNPSRHRHVRRNPLDRSDRNKIYAEAKEIHAAGLYSAKQRDVKGLQEEMALIRGLTYAAKALGDRKLELELGFLNNDLHEAGAQAGLWPTYFHGARSHPKEFLENPVGEAIVAGVAGAVMNHALQANPGPAFVVIDAVTGVVLYTKRATGVGSEAIASCVKKAQFYARRTGHPQIVFLDVMGVRIGTEVNVGMVRAMGITEEIFPDGGQKARLNPAIRVEWDRLTPRRRLAVLEFAGIPEDQASRLCGRAWNVLPPDIQAEVTKGWRDSSRTTRRPRDTGTRHRRHETTVRMNPGGSKRKMTMTIERFAAWVKSKKDPAMWRAFLAKFRGYEKWTHGAKARKVTVEWVETPGVNGLWITYDGGKQPESTYIMPKGSPRKGAWKHPWDTMPDIKHDPEAKIVITKLRGSSKITDFYHK